MIILNWRRNIYARFPKVLCKNKENGMDDTDLRPELIPRECARGRGQGRRDLGDEGRCDSETRLLSTI